MWFNLCIGLWLMVYGSFDREAAGPFAKKTMRWFGLSFIVFAFSSLVIPREPWWLSRMVELMPITVFVIAILLKKRRDAAIEEK